MSDSFACGETAADIVVCCDAMVGIWIWSVWTWRLRLETNFRAHGAKNLVEEFRTYGYPVWVLKMVGIFKMTFSGMMICSIIFPNGNLALGGSAGMVGLMLVAIASHFKVGDELSRNGAAFAMLVFSSFVLVVTYLAMQGGCAASQAEFVPQRMREVLGGCVGLICLNMWFQSYMAGDYNLTNYEVALLPS